MPNCRGVACGRTGRVPAWPVSLCRSVPGCPGAGLPARRPQPLAQCAPAQLPMRPLRQDEVTLAAAGRKQAATAAVPPTAIPPGHRRALIRSSKALIAWHGPERAVAATGWVACACCLPMPRRRFLRSCLQGPVCPWPFLGHWRARTCGGGCPGTHLHDHLRGETDVDKAFVPTWQKRVWRCATPCAIWGRMWGAWLRCAVKYVPWPRT